MFGIRSLHPDYTYESRRHLWKGIIESVCADMLRFFFKDADELFDLQKDFQFLDKELEQLFPPENPDAPKFVDKLVKVFTKTGKEEWILCHIEVQGYKDNSFAKRMFTYFYRILDKYDRPVSAIAILTDANKEFHPRVYEYEFLETKNTFQFKTYKIIQQREKLLMEDDNPFAIVVLTVLLALKKKKLSDEELFNLKFSLAKNLLSKKIPKKKVDDLLTFLQRYVRFADPGYSVKFEKGIEILTDKVATMGIKEQVLDIAKREGIEIGKKLVADKTNEVIRELQSQFVMNLWSTGNYSVASVANLAGVTEDFVLEVINN